MKIKKLKTNPTNIIEIVFSSDNNYVQHLAVTIASILLNNKSKYSYRFHILDGGITDKNKSNIEKLKKIQDFAIQYYKINENYFSSLPLNRKNISVATYYRLELINILSKNIKKVIYLDCDIIVDGDISEFWETDISDVYSGVIEDESSVRNTLKLGLKNYFNAGVLLLNLEKLRENNFQSKWIDYYNKNREIIDLQDQDILNGVFNNNVKWLPLKWNANSTIFTKVEYKHYYTSKEAISAKKNRIIIHFTERFKPWSSNKYHPLRKIYFKYLLYTPFRFQIKTYFIILCKNFIQNIFSVTNQKLHKVITIFGIKLKFLRYIKAE